MKRVLIVDDNAGFLSALWAILVDKTDHDIVIAYSGHEYVRTKQIGGCFDHIFMDIRMPGMDGPQAVANIPPCENEKITFMTACSGDQYVQPLRDKGYNLTKILIKPFRYKEVLEVLDEQ